MADPRSQPPQRLVTHFTNRCRHQQSSGWSELWESGESDLWDRGKPSPALVDFIESRPDALPAPPSGRRLRALVPGCGKGYDVVMLALHGFDAYGLDVSETGAQAARRHAAAELAEPSEINYHARDDWPTCPPGTVNIIAGDFFQRDWEPSCADDGVDSFDLIYDYTFLCALLPEIRKDWARRMSQLLAPRGLLVCLEFPLYKDLSAAGPPWGLRGVHYWNLLAQGGDGIVSEPGEETGPAEGAFQRLLYFKPPRSYENGRGTDMVSVWALKP